MFFQFKIQIKDVTDPPVWRRLLVPASFTFWRFHTVIQAAFGWKNAHLFEFYPGGYQSRPIIGIADPDAPEDMVDSTSAKLSEIFNAAGQQFTYLYDLGDHWEHLVTVENVTDDELAYAVYVNGEGACPPEDCGGPPGYDHLKRVLSDPKNPEHKRMKQWVGLGKNKVFDPNVLNVEVTRVMVSAL